MPETAKFQVGQKIFCLWTAKSSTAFDVFSVKILKIRPNRIYKTFDYRVHYMGWGKQYDCWVQEKFLGPTVDEIPELENVEDTTEYEVVEIIGHKPENETATENFTQFLVKWKQGDPTWESAPEKLEEIPDLVQKYVKKLEKSSKKRPFKKEKSPEIVCLGEVKASVIPPKKAKKVAAANTSSDKNAKTNIKSVQFEWFLKDFKEIWNKFADATKTSCHWNDLCINLFKLGYKEEDVVEFTGKMTDQKKIKIGDDKLILKIEF